MIRNLKADETLMSNQSMMRNKKNMYKIKCFNCQKFGHFTNDCSKPKMFHDMENIYILLELIIISLYLVVF